MLARLKQHQVPPLAVDLGLAAVLLVWTATGRLVTAPALDARLPAALALAAVVALSLALRRQAPLLGYAIGTAALISESVFIGANPLSPYANLMALYSLGLYGSRTHARWGPVILLPGVLGYFADEPTSAAVQTGVMFIWLLAWAAGYGTARRREAQDLARRRQRGQAISDERARMARELHDLLGHTLNVMLVQAGAGRMVLDSDPAKARELLASIEATGREALDELDRVLGVLRVPDGEGDLRLGLAELPRLAQRMTDAGMAVAVRLDPDLRTLPRGVDLSAYRIVQEALTNALRHGQAQTATVSVRCAGDALELAVRDDGRGPQPGYRAGRGLLGISERVASLAGTLEHGGGDGGGFQLRAVLPVT